jgi:hypothetical protein
VAVAESTTKKVEVLEAVVLAVMVVAQVLEEVQALVQPTQVLVGAVSLMLVAVALVVQESLLSPTLIPQALLQSAEA